MFSRIIRLFTLVAVPALTLAYTPAMAADPLVCDARVNDTHEKLLECVTLEGVREHQAAFQAIADEHDGTRAAGTPGYDASVQYVVDRMTAAGYAVTRHEFPFTYVAPASLRQTAPITATYETGSYTGSGGGEPRSGRDTRAAHRCGCPLDSRQSARRAHGAEPRRLVRNRHRRDGPHLLPLADGIAASPPGPSAAHVRGLVLGHRRPRGRPAVREPGRHRGRLGRAARGDRASARQPRRLRSRGGGSAPGVAGSACLRRAGTKKGRFPGPFS